MASVESDLAAVRNLFFTYGLQDGFTRDQLANYIYYPTPSMIDAAERLTSADAVHKVFMESLPSDCAAAGVAQGETLVADPEKPFRALPKPLTVYIFPGMFGEFMDTYTFRGLFNNNSAFARS